MPAARSPHLTQIFICNSFAFCSMQIGAHPRTQELSPNIATQTLQAITNLQLELERRGLELKDVVKVTVYLTDMGDYNAMNRAYAGAFGDVRPARTVVGVMELPSGSKGNKVQPALVAIDAMAYRPY